MPMQKHNVYRGKTGTTMSSHLKDLDIFKLFLQSLFFSTNPFHHGCTLSVATGIGTLFFFHY